MARMYPSGINPDSCEGVSAAELAVYRELRDQLPEDWTVLHSLWVNTHRRKAHAEADFVVIGSKAVIFLEVKGGTVSREAGQWKFINRHGISNTKREGPFDQARGVYYAIKRHLSDLGHQELFNDYVWGYGVVMPECILKVPQSDPQIHEALLLDQRRFPEGLAEFLNELADYWTDHVLSLKAEAGRPPESLHRVLPSQVRQRVLTDLRPDFEPILGPGPAVRQAEAQMLRLTDEQFKFLDLAAVNDRVLLLGGAGTGKTVLALEQARRESASGKRVLFTCFNRLLADHLAATVQTLPGGKNIEVLNYHQLVFRLVREAGLSTNVPEDWDTFNSRINDLAYPAIERLDCFGRYDFLVVDEAQDLMTREFMDVADMLTGGGLSAGHWLMCVDPQQAIFETHYHSDYFGELASLAVKVPLSVNCRNTRQIAANVKGLTGAGTTRILGAEGPEVAIEYYRTFEEYLKLLKKAMNRLVTDFHSAEISPYEIALLTSDTSYIPADILEPNFFTRRLSDIREPGSSSPGSIQFGTVQSFKGLEAGAVILVGLQGLETVAERRLLYVGASRARWVLTVLLPIKANGYIREHFDEVRRALEQ